MLREKMAELRADEARCGFEAIPDVVAAAGFAVPCYTASASGDKTVRLWGVDDGECKRVLQGHSGEVNSVAFAPTRPGEAALLASASDDKTVRLWGVEDGERTRVLEGTRIL
ncbi:U4 snRNA binding protein [Aureococcus anophagefferens]|nr:U4 snRNA binding protein [Aureococcus anophagefferens]